MLLYRISFKMTKTPLIAQLANQLNVSKNMSKQMVDSLLDLITTSLSKGKEVRIQGFGTFKVSHRAARNGVNPRTGAPLKIKAMKVAGFKAGKELKTKVNK
jgi:DNA-binding protein HU-beta